MVTITPELFLAGLDFALGAAGTKATYDAQKAEAARRAEVGRLQGRQYVNELFLAKAQAKGAATRRERELTEAESVNTAFLEGRLGRGDRSVEAFLKRQAKTAGEDIADIQRADEQITAKYATQAAVAYTYGQDTAEGMRMQASANLLTNLSNLTQNISPLLARGGTPTRRLDTKGQIGKYSSG